MADAVTLKFLAEQAGVSIRTVCRVLHGNSSVKESRRKEILALAEKYHYTPNITARNLRMKRKNFVGILTCNASSEIFLQKLLDLQQKLEKSGFYPVIGTLSGQKEQMEKLFEEWSGIAEYTVLTFPPEITCPPELPELAQKARLIPIFVDQEISCHGHCLTLDRSCGIREAMEYFLNTGRKRICRCGNIASRSAGFLEAFRHDTKAHYEVIPSDCEFADGLKIAPEIMKRNFDAVFFDTDRMALGFLHYANDHHIPVPEKIAVAGFDNDTADSLCYPSLSTVAHPVEELNEAIVEIVKTRPEQPVKRCFPTRFICRKSS